MRGREQLGDVLRELGARHAEIVALYVFGSRAGGTERPDSDLDLGVLFASPQPLARTLALEEELARALGGKLDLVDAARAGPFLALEIIRGERLHCTRPLEADRFELYVLRRAGDLLPFERARQAALLSGGA